jgi:uncharacterized protein
MAHPLRRLLTVLLALLWLAAPAATLAQTFPKLTGRVVDDAHLLTPDQAAALTQKLAGLQQRTGRQLVVATIPDLQGYEIEDYGYRLGRTWAIGQKGKDDGIVFIVAPNERRVRIEVGYGAEGVVTDALSALIIADEVTPRFKAGDYSGGIDAGVDQLIRLLQLTPEEAQRYAAEVAAKQKREGERADIGVAVVVIGFILFFVILPMAMRRRHGRHYRGGWGPVVIWGPGFGGGSGSDSWGGGGGGSWGGGGGGFSGGGGSFGGGGASGSW